MTLFEDWMGIQEKSGWRGMIFFEDGYSKIRIVLKGHT